MSEGCNGGAGSALTNGSELPSPVARLALVMVWATAAILESSGADMYAWKGGWSSNKIRIWRDDIAAV